MISSATSELAPPHHVPAQMRRDLLFIGSICILVGTIGWVFYGVLFSSAPAQDFMVFYTAARSCIEGNLALIFDGDAFTAKINGQFGDWLFRPLDLHPWVYPPLYLLVVVPLGFVPFGVAYGLFIGTTFVLLNCAIRCFVPRGYQRWVCAASLLLSPATAWTVAVGQNSFMTTALLVGGIGLVPRSPLLAGALLGLLACKPQLWLLVPVALFAAREWTVLTSTVFSACLVALASVAVFGVEPWREWLTLMLEPSPMYQHWLQFGRLNGQSAYTEAFLLGAPAGVANLLQGLATLFCAVVVWRCFRAPDMQRNMQLAVLLTATVLGAPHVANYDAVMVAVAVSLFLCRALEDGLRFGDAVLIVVVWSIELLDPPSLIRLGLTTPLVLCLFLVVVIARGCPGALGVTTTARPVQPAVL
jgi:alpha-1,2-mannosyltransferase